MKKTVRIISTILLTIMLVTSIAGVVFAAPDIDKTIGDIDGAKAGDTTKVTNIGGKIIIMKYGQWFKTTMIVKLKKMNFQNG